MAVLGECATGREDPQLGVKPAKVETVTSVGQAEGYVPTDRAL
jgi:hypothetical protein